MFNHHHQRAIYLLACLFFLLLTIKPLHGVDLPEKCSLVPVNGSCKALIDKYYFDQGTRTCKEYMYDGCGPVVPFDEMEQCRSLCEAGEEPRLVKVTRGDGKPFAILTLEYPKSWDEEPMFKIMADGDPVEAREIGGGFDQRVKTVDFMLLRETPTKSLAVEVRHKSDEYRLTTPFVWVPFMANLLDHLGKKEAIFAPVGLDFLTIGATKVSILHNGKPLAAESAIKSTFKGVLHVNPAWKRGFNIIVINARAASGDEHSNEYTFMYFPEKRLKVGEKGRLLCGVSGSKSGPFYDAKVSTEAVYITDSSPQSEVLNLDKEGWPVWKTYDTVEFMGAAPGTAVLEITQKWFLISKEPEVVASHKLYVDPGKKSESRLLHDPVQDDPAYAEIFKGIDSEVDKTLAGDSRRGSMGFCHVIWETKKRILKTKYGIEWETPAEMNPQVIFD